MKKAGFRNVHPGAAGVRNARMTYFQVSAKAENLFEKPE